MGHVHTEQFRSVKEQFNTTADANSVEAVYKDPAQAQKHIWYVAMDLIDLSHEFGGKPVKYTHAGHTLSITDKDDEKNVSAKIPAADQWPGGPKR